MTDRRQLTDDEWFQCHYCGKHSNVRVRACCDFGRASDLKRLPPEMTANWEHEAEQLLPERDGRGYPGSWVEDPGALIALYAARTLVLLDEVARLRECRDGMGKLAQELGEARSQFSEQRSRVVEAIRLLGPGGAKLALAAEKDVRRVLVDDTWYYVGAVRYCARCRSSNCERQPNMAAPMPCKPPGE